MEPQIEVPGGTFLRCTGLNGSCSLFRLLHVYIIIEQQQIHFT